MCCKRRVKAGNFDPGPQTLFLFIYVALSFPFHLVPSFKWSLPLFSSISKLVYDGNKGPFVLPIVSESLKFLGFLFRNKHPKQQNNPCFDNSPDGSFSYSPLCSKRKETGRMTMFY